MKFICIISFSIPHIRSVQFSYSVLSNSLRSHEPQHTRPPCPSPTPRVHWNSCPSRRWCHPTISSSVVPFSSCPQSFLASGSFQRVYLLCCSLSGHQLLGWSKSSFRILKKTGMYFLANSIVLLRAAMTSVIVVQLLSHVWLFATPRTAALQASHAYHDL